MVCRHKLSFHLYIFQKRRIPSGCDAEVGVGVGGSDGGVLGLQAVEEGGEEGVGALGGRLVPLARQLEGGGLEGMTPGGRGRVSPQRAGLARLLRTGF